MNAILTNNPTLRITTSSFSSVILEWKRIKNKIRLMVKIDGVYDTGKSNSDIEKYDKACTDWQKQNENLIVKTPMPKDLVDKEIKIYSAVDPRDQFDMVFGMRKCIEKLFSEYYYVRDFRTEVYNTFDATYGRGKCLPKVKAKSGGGLPVYTHDTLVGEHKSVALTVISDTYCSPDGVIIRRGNNVNASQNGAYWDKAQFYGSMIYKDSIAFLVIKNGVTEFLVSYKYICLLK